MGASIAAAVGALVLSGCASDPVARTRPSGPPPPLLEGTRSEALAGPAVQAGAAAGSGAAAATVTGLTDELIDPVLAFVGGREVRASELLETWLQRDSAALKGTLNLLIGARLAQAEADRLGLRVPPQLVVERGNQHLATFEETFLRDGETLDEFVRQRLDLDPQRFVERLRDDTLRELVTERVVRAHSLATEHARVRLLLVMDEAELELVQGKLAAGADFAAVVHEHSLDESAERGGLVAYLARSDRAPLSRLAFQTPVGTVSEPLTLDGATLLLRVERRPPPLLGTWQEVGPTVEETLLEDPVSEEEFLVWQLAMEGRHGVDLRPFYEFVREPMR